MDTLGSFCLIKDEAQFIRPHLQVWLPHLTEMVFFDGGSTDGTLEVIKEFIKKEHGHKIKLFGNMDPKDLTNDYTRLSNEAMRSLSTDLAMFLHPDMMPDNPDEVLKLPDGITAATVNMASFAGEPGGDIYQIISGRTNRWKNIYRLRNPDLGAHYHGHYGAANEDTYFSEITGAEHNFHGDRFDRYPYTVTHLDLKVNHYSDVRPYARRLDRMEKCLINQGYNRETAKEVAPIHPRVSLKDNAAFKFVKITKPCWLEVK